MLGFVTQRENNGQHKHHGPLPTTKQTNKVGHLLDETNMITLFHHKPTIISTAINKHLRKSCCFLSSLFFSTVDPPAPAPAPASSTLSSSCCWRNNKNKAFYHGTAETNTCCRKSPSRISHIAYRRAVTQQNWTRISLQEDAKISTTLHACFSSSTLAVLPTSKNTGTVQQQQQQKQQQQKRHKSTHHQEDHDQQKKRENNTHINPLAYDAQKEKIQSKTQQEGNEQESKIEQNEKRQHDDDDDDDKIRKFWNLSTATRKQLQAIWTQSQSLPNQITLARIGSTPILCHFIMTNQYKLAVTGCILAGISDVLDGYIARNYNQKTVLGTYLDPLADKIFINGIAFSLTYSHILPWWCTSLWLGRDVILIGMAYRTVALATQGSGNNVADPSSTPLKIKPLMISKVNTLFQFGTIWTGLGCMAVGYQDMLFSSMAVVGEWSLSPMDGLCMVSCGTTVLSGLGYMDGKAMKKRKDVK